MYSVAVVVRFMGFHDEAFHLKSNLKDETKFPWDQRCIKQLARRKEVLTYIHSFVTKVWTANFTYSKLFTDHGLLHAQREWKLFIWKSIRSGTCPRLFEIGSIILFLTRQNLRVASTYSLLLYISLNSLDQACQTGVNFTNILRAAFLRKTLEQLFCANIVGENDS